MLHGLQTNQVGFMFKLMFEEPKHNIMDLWMGYKPSQGGFKIK